MPKTVILWRRLHGSYEITTCEVPREQGLEKLARGWRLMKDLDTRCLKLLNAQTENVGKMVQSAITVEE